MTPREALESVFVWVSSKLRSRGGRPGEVINSLSSEKREILKDLKSDDIASVRQDEIFGSEDYYDNKRISEMLMEADKKLKIK